MGNAKVVDVTFVDGNRYTAKVIASDIYSDIAVLQISQNASQQQQQILSSVKPLVIGNSSNIEVGDTVIAIGNPFGLSDTMTTGIVSGIGRSLPAASGGGFSIPNAIQTDAPINPGNSGGPLLDMQGKMVGMNTAIVSGTATFSGIGFAIPSDTITKIVPALIEKGYYPHPYLGLRDGTLTSDLAGIALLIELRKGRGDINGMLNFLRNSTLSTIDEKIAVLYSYANNVPTWKDKKLNPQLMERQILSDISSIARVRNNIDYSQWREVIKVLTSLIESMDKAGYDTKEIRISLDALR